MPYWKNLYQRSIPRHWLKHWLCTAANFWRGILARISADFELWAVRERERLQQLALLGFTELRQRQQKAGAIDAALTTNRQLLKLAPWDEAAHRQQMRLLSQSGQRAAALAHFEISRQLLADELDVELDAETIALYEEIQAGSSHAVDEGSAPAEWASPFAASKLTPALKDTAPNNLIAPLAAFIGRQAEKAFIQTQLLSTLDCRLLTINGPGGMGKTALALAAGQQLLQTDASSFVDGIFWVPLADLHPIDQAEPPQAQADNVVVGETILRAIAEALNTQLAIQLSSLQQLQTYLRPRQLLLILDNFEHLLSGTHALVRLLTQAPGVKALVTSRTRLNVRGESILALDKLSLPALPKQKLAQGLPATLSAAAMQALPEKSEAVAMFVQRARQLDPSFRVNGETVGPLVQICQLVEGLPLGIELATSMLPLLSCHELAKGIVENLDFLEGDTRDLPREQRTLQAVFERSWRLLSPEEQQGLARLAIFPGSFHRDAAISIAGATLPLLKRLTDQSLVNKTGESRYTLHRTVRAFAEQKLQQWPGQIGALQRQYGHFYLEFLAGLEAGLFGSAYGETVTQIRGDLDNIHTAWRWAVAHQMYSEMSHCLSALLWYYEQQGFYADVFEMCDQALHALRPMYEAQPNTSGTTLTLLIGRLHTLVGLWHLRQGRLPQAHAAYEVSWSILQHEDNPIAAVYCLGFWGASLRAKDPQRSVALLTAALQLAQAQGAVWMQATLYQLLGESSLYAGDYVEAKAKISAGHVLVEQINWARGLAVSHKVMGRIYLARGDYCQAEEHFRQSVEIAQHHQLTQYYLSSLIMLGEALRLQGRFANARTYYEEARKLANASEAVVLLAPVLWEEGSLAEQCGNYAQAKVSFTESLAIGTPNGWVHVLPTLGWALIGLGELAEAQEYFQTTMADAQARGYMPIYLETQAGLAYLTVLQAKAGQTSDAQYHATIAQAVTSLQQIAKHPAAPQQTHDRVDQLVATIACAIIAPSSSRG
ncbi:MAG: BTAD domain-containing putative transcriptional regulator [Caldilineaceae bacterium]